MKPPTPKRVSRAHTRPAPARVPTSQRLAWAPVAGADAYEIQLFSGAELLLQRRTTTASFDVPKRWQARGKWVSLAPGTYRWYVWSIRDGERDERAVVQSQLTITSAA